MGAANRRGRLLPRMRYTWVPGVALSKGRTAVHGQDLTGNVVGVFAGKEYEGRTDVLRLPEPTQGYADGPLFECGLVDFLREVSDSHRTPRYASTPESTGIRYTTGICRLVRS